MQSMEEKKIYKMFFNELDNKIDNLDTLIRAIERDNKNTLTDERKLSSEAKSIMGKAMLLEKVDSPFGKTKMMKDIIIKIDESINNLEYEYIVETRKQKSNKSKTKRKCRCK